MISALQQVSRRPEATETLKLGHTMDDEVAANLEVLTAPAAAAERIYTGVLFHALGMATLDSASKVRARRSIVVFSGLFGVVKLGDRIPAYRLAADVTLPEIGSVASWWRSRLTPILDEVARDQLIVDVRSTSYRQMWHPDTKASDWVVVDVPGASHWAKYTRGQVVRRLAQTAGRVRRPEALLDLLEPFRPQLDAPSKTGGPLRLTVRQLSGMIEK